MFVVRYLMVAVALVAGIILWGVAADLGFWPILRRVVLAVLALQAGVLVLIAVLALGSGGGGRSIPPSRSRLVAGKDLPVPVSSKRATPWPRYTAGLACSKNCLYRRSAPNSSSSSTRKGR